MGLVKFSLPFLYFGLTFLLVPQACANSHLSSCPLDPSLSPYRMLLYEQEKPCFFRCFKTTFYILLIPYTAFGLGMLLNGYLYRKKIYARIAKQKEMAQTHSRLMRERNTILEMHERTDITA